MRGAQGRRDAPARQPGAAAGFPIDRLRRQAGREEVRALGTYRLGDAPRQLAALIIDSARQGRPRKVDRVPSARAWPSQSQETTGLPSDPPPGGCSHCGRDTITVGQRHDEAGGRPTRGRDHRQHPRRETRPDRRSLVRGANPSTDDRSVDVIDRARMRLPAVRPAKPDETTTSFGGRLDQADAFVVVTPSSTTAIRRRSPRSSTTRAGSGRGSRSRSEPTPARPIQGEYPEHHDHHTARPRRRSTAPCTLTASTSSTARLATRPTQHCCSCMASPPARRCSATSSPSCRTATTWWPPTTRASVRAPSRPATTSSTPSSGSTQSS